MVSDHTGHTRWECFAFFPGGNVFDFSPKGICNIAGGFNHRYWFYTPHTKPSWRDGTGRLAQREDEMKKTKDPWGGNGISRREILRKTGGAALMAGLAGTGLGSLISCSREEQEEQA